MGTALTLEEQGEVTDRSVERGPHGRGGRRHRSADGDGAVTAVAVAIVPLLPDKTSLATLTPLIVLCPIEQTG